MEENLGQDSTPSSGQFDKSRVLNVRPLRCINPIFSSPNASSSAIPQVAAPFVCVSPTGPFPPGLTPIYPFYGLQETPCDAPNQAEPFGYSPPISNAVPLNAFQTPSYSTPGTCKRNTRKQFVGGAAGEDEDGYDDERPKKKSQRKSRGRQESTLVSTEVDLDTIVENILASSNIMSFDSVRDADGDKESVGYALLIYDSLRRKITQIEEAKVLTPGFARRPDLKAGTVLLNKGIRTNVKKRIGAVPGVEVGDIFFFRMELCLVGLHAPSMAGIDYIGVKTSQEEEPLAVSIVSSGGYEDNVEDGDVLIYSGQGGNINSRDKEVMDQKLERGNLALDKSSRRGNEIRVIRGIKDLANPTGKIYVYDGLYKIEESWTEKGKSGCNVFKHKLIRIPGQPEAFMMWKSIMQWREGTASRTGLILPDLTSGVESIPVSLVNDVDDEKWPAHFTYSCSIKYPESINSLENYAGCTCQGGCLPNNPKCLCTQRNRGSLPYILNGVIVSQKSLIYECGSSCKCPRTCRNRVSQGGLKVRFEVFKTKDKGWALRSWDPIRGGAFICEYAGVVLDISKVEENKICEDEYIFDATRTYQPVGILAGDSNETPKIPFPLLISAKGDGNVARFMNHSCSPNVFWQPVVRESNKEFRVHVVFHAIRHIPPMTELTYNYGVVPPEKTEQMKKKCNCESPKCGGYFY
ncbi:histone-lysine N-methyltransferase, H3 lysine-9 specific SUVH1-like [Carica papaya]|uniref:histone-lysine N-methyltransferase, H3 lysine-9 specific SUVH1-like n=1 Tax=Carica papaya TaxID=3649 RepID=UPI000B8C8675|nr:histone-lysine N-methyltransferase, H3 lysine-9 specific SUVH1-like [Carica papaya]XP_021901221.1 histone-lysine N-methyltransferase, H3 lysine-9 specific SUVH1-like [Carica papaya]XP_021901222.1 histone-lysine N-methyltransferase, H3 lysine-9 specific SUVH1-like [Carica papaya]